MRFVAIALMIFFGACSVPKTVPNTPSDGYQLGDHTIAPTPYTKVHWKAVIVAGDDSIPNFDRATDKMDQLLAQGGITERLVLSADQWQIRNGKAASVEVEMERAFHKLNPSQGDGCFLFMTSHGSREGLYLARDTANRQRLRPTDVGELLDRYCGDLPSVAIISACYSGIFLDSAVTKPNRIILTAARGDRTSFGCGTETEYTYYDACILDAWTQSQSFEGLFRNISDCVATKERDKKVKPSLPQAFWGRKMKGLAIPR